jgi:hypothetical protein
MKVTTPNTLFTPKSAWGKAFNPVAFCAAAVLSVSIISAVAVSFEKAGVPDRSPVVVAASEARTQEN